MNDYITILSESQHEIVVKKSRFICNIKPIVSVEQGLEFINKIKKLHYNASHNCFAIVGTPSFVCEKAYDDGEPQGTAGIPILSTLKSNDIKGVIAVVTRYFGGIKLGASGLTLAYTKAVNEAIKSAKKIKVVWCSKYRVTLDYSSYATLKSKVKDCMLIREELFTDKVNFMICVPIKEQENFISILSDVSKSEAFPEQIINEYQVWNY